jgi:AcrR family transcriptional regulator
MGMSRSAPAWQTTGRIREPAQERSRRSLERILDAAAVLIAKNGVESLTVADVVHRARSSVGSFYARFADKDALVREVQDRFVEHCEERMSAAIAGLDRTDIRLETAVGELTASVAAVFREHASLIDAFIRQSGRDQVLRRRVDLAFERLSGETAELFARRFSIAPIAAQTLIRIVTATFEQYVSATGQSRWTDWDTLTRELRKAGLADLLR